MSDKDQKQSAEIVSFNKEAFSLESFETEDFVVDELERRLEMALAAPMTCGTDNCHIHGTGPGCDCDTDNCNTHCPPT